MRITVTMSHPRRAAVSQGERAGKAHGTAQEGCCGAGTLDSGQVGRPLGKGQGDSGSVSPRARVPAPEPGQEPGGSGFVPVSAFLFHLSVFVLGFQETCLWGDLMIKASDIICQAGEKCTFLCLLSKNQETSANNEPKI